MPGILKVGLTSRTVAERQNELFSTGVPLPFKEIYSFSVPTSKLKNAESAVHSELKKAGLHLNKEFFKGEESTIFRITRETIRTVVTKPTFEKNIRELTEKTYLSLKVNRALKDAREANENSHYFSLMKNKQDVAGREPLSFKDKCIELSLLLAALLFIPTSIISYESSNSAAGGLCLAMFFFSIFGFVVVRRDNSTRAKLFETKKAELEAIENALKTIKYIKPLRRLSEDEMQKASSLFANYKMNGNELPLTQGRFCICPFCSTSLNTQFNTTSLIVQANCRVCSLSWPHRVKSI